MLNLRDEEIMKNKEGPKSYHIWALFYTLLLFCVVLLFGYAVSEKRLSPAEALLASCSEEHAPYLRGRCLVPYFKFITASESAEAAMQKALALQKEGVIDDCHLSAHVIGEANLQKNNGSVGAAFATCSMGCIEGCYHGVMEAYVAYSGDIEGVLNGVSDLCKEVGEDVLLRRQCLHGLGHGIMQHGYKGLSNALVLCERLPKKEEQDVCYGGVFMENINQHLSQSSRDLAEVLPTLCTEVYEDRSHLLPLCVRSIGEGLMFYTGHNTEEATLLCEALPQEEKSDCIAGVKAEEETHTRLLKETQL